MIGGIRLPFAFPPTRRDRVRFRSAYLAMLATIGL